jgi:diguanylate cyclase (GGDEF)-like protein
LNLRLPSKTEPLIAGLVLAVCVAIAVVAVQSAAVAAHRNGRERDVEEALQASHSLVVARVQRATARAGVVAAEPAIQQAFARRDRAALQLFVRTHPRVTLELWDGGLVGRSASGAVAESVAVYGTDGLLGRVVVSTAPTSALLEQARRTTPEVTLLYQVGQRVVAAAPLSARSVEQAQVKEQIWDTVPLAPGGRAQLIAFARRPTSGLGVLWAILAGAFVFVAAFLMFRHREQRRFSQPLPNAVRDAVAMVGETLAATHNPNALLPVILRASVEATDAVGGQIEREGAVVALRGAPVTAGSEVIEVPLDVGEGKALLMTLHAGSGTFSDTARDAASWIAGQALIALENARLHGLVQEQAVTDELTGLANRRRFSDQLDLELARAARSGSPLALVVADIDDFKKINDTWGHATGDVALQRFASILRGMIRDIDLPVRLGGEEFGLLLPDTDLEGATRLANRIRATVAATEIQTEGVAFRLTASFGVSCHPLAAKGDDLLTDADRCLYEAKRTGKNRVVASYTRSSVRPG